MALRRSRSRSIALDGPTCGAARLKSGSKVATERREGRASVVEKREKMRAKGMRETVEKCMVESLVGLRV